MNNNTVHNKYEPANKRPEVIPEYYEVIFPPGQLGICLETCFHPKDIIIVKEIKLKSFADEKTRISVGDKLICVNDVAVDNMSFEDVLKRIKNECKSHCGCKLTFQSVEDQNRVTSELAMRRLDDSVVDNEDSKVLELSAL